MNELAQIFNSVAPYVGYGVAALTGLLMSKGLIKNAFYSVEQEHVGLVQRFGKHVRTNTDSGLKMKIPYFEKVSQVSLQEFQTTENLETKTTDDLFVDLPISIHFQISDPATYKFKKGNAVDLMKKNVSAAVRKYTSQKSFQELYDERQEIRDGVLKAIEDKIAEFGIQINDIVIDEPRASDAVKKTFDSVRSSSLAKEVAKNDAEADYTRRVRSAEADKQRNILIGEGVAGFREKIASGYSVLRKQLVADGVDPAAADAFMAEAMRLDTLRDIGDKGNMVIVSPDSSSGNRLAEMQTLSHTMGRTPAAEQDTKPKRSAPVASEQKPAAPSV